MDYILSQIGFGIISSLLSSGLIALLLIYFFRKPILILRADYFKGENNENPLIDLHIRNKKWYVGFGLSEVHFSIFLPEELKSSYFEIMTTEGGKDWEHVNRNMNNFSVDGAIYNQYRGFAHLPVHPNSDTHIVRIKGNFPRNKVLKIYYCFKTPFGNIPSSVVYGKMIPLLESNRLPHLKIQTD